MYKLILKQKIIKDGSDYYTFITSANSDKQLTLSHVEALNLIKRYDSRDRNCKVSAGAIGLKAGQGRLPVHEIRDNAKSKVVRLITSNKYLKLLNPSIYIHSNEVKFAEIKYNVGFLQRNKNILHSIDRASIINEGLLKIETPYGIASVDDLSTGCKTLLNIAYLTEQLGNRIAIVNVNECGNNALRKAFDMVSGTNIHLYISHDTAAVDMQYKFIVNGKELKDEFEFVDIIWGE